MYCTPVWYVAQELMITVVCNTSKGKGSPIREMSVGFQSRSRSWAVSLQVTEAINPTVGCDYFLPSLQLPPQPLSIGRYQIILLGDRRNQSTIVKSY